MGALSKSSSSTIRRTISAYFSQFILQAFRFILISTVALYHSYQCKISRNEYIALINNNSYKFLYGKKCSRLSPAELECSICLVEFEEGDAVRQLRCNHGFHRKCLDQWFHDGQATCPICREYVVPEKVSMERIMTVADDQAVQDGLREELAQILLPIKKAWG